MLSSVLRSERAIQMNRPHARVRRQSTRGERRRWGVVAQVRFVPQRTDWRARLLASAASDSPFVKHVVKSHMRTRHGRYYVLRTRVGREETHGH